MPVVNGEAST